MLTHMWFLNFNLFSRAGLILHTWVVSTTNGDQYLAQHIPTYTDLFCMMFLWWLDKFVVLPMYFPVLWIVWPTLVAYCIHYYLSGVEMKGCSASSITWSYFSQHNNDYVEFGINFSFLCHTLFICNLNVFQILASNPESSHYPFISCRNFVNYNMSFWRSDYLCKYDICIDL